MDGGRSGNYGRGGGRGGSYRPRGSGGRGSQYQPRPQGQRQGVEQPPQQGVGRGVGGGRTGAGSPWGQPPTHSSFPVQSPARPTPPPPRSSSGIDLFSFFNSLLWWMSLTCHGFHLGFSFHIMWFPFLDRFDIVV